MLQPEGVPSSYSYSVLIDLNTSDILGSSFNNLDNLLRMPYGCGEQNMVNFAPNIFILKYLTAVNRVTPAIKSKAERYMVQGYQREQTYRHKDGSFSAFGERDPSGSMCDDDGDDDDMRSSDDSATNDDDDDMRSSGDSATNDDDDDMRSSDDSATNDDDDDMRSSDDSATNDDDDELMMMMMIMMMRRSSDDSATNDDDDNMREQ
ncbi:hypothetical protein QZH41_006301 [Actinostola sp. cb2023]|nr:hypothetical protein QZH41_006301 [Actinostola sp. cb2023]